MQEKIAIIADTGCNLPQNTADRYHIRMIPLRVVYEDREYIDRLDITPAEVYVRMPEKIPKTSLPNPGVIKTLFSDLVRDGYTHVIAIHISSGLSGTYNAVKTVAQEFNDKLHIEVIDSKVLSMATGWLVLDVAQHAEAGWPFAEIVEHVRQKMSSSKVFFTLKTLHYLRVGGRINTVAASLGTFLNLKPIISVNEEGKYYTFAKVRGSVKATGKLVKIAENIINEGAVKLAVMHSGVQKEAEKILHKLQDMPNVKEFLLSEIGPALGVHTGPGLLGVTTLRI